MSGLERSQPDSRLMSPSPLIRLHWFVPYVACRQPGSERSPTSTLSLLRHRDVPETGGGSEPCKRRVSRGSGETESKGRNPRQLAELPHITNGSRDEVSRAPDGERSARPSRLFSAQFHQAKRVVLGRTRNAVAANT